MNRFVKKCGIIIMAILLPTAVALSAHREIVIAGGGADSESLSRLEKRKATGFLPAFENLKALDGPSFSAVGTRIVTAYTAGRIEENDDRPCEGAYGDNICELVEKGYVIFATNEFKRGAVLRVGDVVGVVLDRTNSRYQHRVDVAFRNYNDAIKFGKKTLEIYYYEQSTKGNH